MSAEEMAQRLVNMMGGRRLRDMGSAIFGLSQAMGNPALDWSNCESVQVAVVDEAARRFREAAEKQEG